MAATLSKAGLEGNDVRFQALTNAPMLRDGVRLSFMAIPQEECGALTSLSAGVDVTLRLGHCCPDIVEGRITAVSADPIGAVLMLGLVEWALEPGLGGEANDVPGIRSEVWCVRGRVTPAASPAPHT